MSVGNRVCQRWTPEEDRVLLDSVKSAVKRGESVLKGVLAASVKLGRTGQGARSRYHLLQGQRGVDQSEGSVPLQVSKRSQRWTPEEDRVLLDSVKSAVKRGESVLKGVLAASVKLGRTGQGAKHRYRLLQRQRRGDQSKRSVPLQVSKWAPEEEAVIWEEMQKGPNKMAAFARSAERLGKGAEGVAKHYYRYMEPALRAALLDEVKAWGSPVPMDRVAEVSARFGLNPIWVNGFWGNICKTSPEVNARTIEVMAGRVRVLEWEAARLKEENSRLKEENARLADEARRYRELLSQFDPEEPLRLREALADLAGKYEAARRFGVACLEQLSRTSGRLWRCRRGETVVN